MSQKRYTPELIIGMLRKKVEQERSTSAITALGGWDNLKQVETYTKSARRQKLAEDMYSRRQNRAEKEWDISSDET